MNKIVQMELDDFKTGGYLDHEKLARYIAKCITEKEESSLDECGAFISRLANDGYLSPHIELFYIRIIYGARWNLNLY